MIKIWGRNTSSNVQKVMWAIGEIGLPHERIDIGGPFGKNREAGLSGDESERAGADAGGGGRLPAVGIEHDRALSRRQAPAPAVLEPADLRMRARYASAMDGLAALGRSGPAITPVFWGLIRTPPEKRDHAAIEDAKKKTTDGDGDARRRSSAKTAYRRRRWLLLRRHSGRRSWPTAIASSCPSGRRMPQFRALVSPRSPRARRSRTRSPPYRLA